MKVKDLIEKLQACNPESTVRLSYPHGSAPGEVTEVREYIWSIDETRVYLAQEYND